MQQFVEDIGLSVFWAFLGVLRVIGTERPQALDADAIDNRSARAVVAAGGSVTAAAL